MSGVKDAKVPLLAYVAVITIVSIPTIAGCITRCPPEGCLEWWEKLPWCEEDNDGEYFTEKYEHYNRAKKAVQVLQDRGWEDINIDGAGSGGIFGDTDYIVEARCYA